MTIQTKVTAKTLPDAARAAAGFRRMWKTQRTNVTENYIELISDLLAVIGEARLTALAEHLGVSQGIAAKVDQRLRRDGWVKRVLYHLSIFYVVRRGGRGNVSGLPPHCP